MITLLITPWSDEPGSPLCFVAERSAIRWDKDNCIKRVQVTPEQYDVMCGQLEEWYSLQDTIDELLQEEPQAQT